MTRCTQDLLLDYTVRNAVTQATFVRGRSMSKAAIYIQKRWRGLLTRKDIKESEKCWKSLKKLQKNRKTDLAKHKLALLWSMYPETLDVIEKLTAKCVTIDQRVLYEVLLYAHAFCKLNNRDVTHIEKLGRILHETSAMCHTTDNKP